MATVIQIVLLGVIAALALTAVVLLIRVGAALAAASRGDGVDRLDRVLREELARAREEAADLHARLREETGRVHKELREELRGSTKQASEAVVTIVNQLSTSQQNQFEAFSQRIGRMAETNEQRVDRVRTTVEERLKALQEDNSAKLEKMRQTVDEKLQGTLDKRLGESFKQVSERLEQVHKGLGEMQSLAQGVGDLKRVMTNVKTRGTWGEVQLGSILEQVLSPEQFERNVAVKDGSERVEFAVRLPGAEGDPESSVWLPVDSKCPQEDYLRLLDAADRADREAVDEASKALAARVKACGKDIRDKYINPPRTTDFAILFLPTEGLYAEVLRRPGLAEELQRDCRVVVAGPMTFAAILNSLQMGFRTLAIQKRSSEVWSLLGAVKTEFGKFGDVLSKVKEKLSQASKTIEEAEKRTRVMNKKLKEVEQLPSGQTAPLLPSAAEDAD